MAAKLHILLTYNCSLRCKHCYVFSDQKAPGRMSLSQVSKILNDGLRIPGMRWVYFGGGEPFTQYPLLLKGVQRARKLGYDVGVETNGYFGRSIEAGLRFLRPLAEMGIRDIRISNDSLHYKNPGKSPASKAVKAALRLGIPTTVVQIPFSKEQPLNNAPQYEGFSIDKPPLMYSGRASETLSKEKQAFRSDHFTKCPRKDLAFPERLYIDAYGFVQICPGIAIGNINEKSLARITADYKVQEHQIIRSLHNQGPSGLIRNTRFNPDELFVDACHCCYSARQALIDSNPELLGPRQVYGF